MMEICRGVRCAAPAQPRQERAVARPPQPNAGQRQDQHTDAGPTDDGAAGIFGNRQVFMEAVQPADERGPKIDHIERPRGRGIEVDVDEPHRAALDVSEVNKLLKMHRQMADMMKKMGKGGRMPQMPGMGGMPGGLPPGMFPGRR